MEQEGARRIALSRGPRLLVKIGLAIIVGALIAVVAWSVARRDPRAAIDPSSLGNRALLSPGAPETYVGSHVALTDSLVPLTQTVRIDGDDRGRILDTTPIVCHGGRARILWTVGNLEPTVPNTGITLTARLDGQPIGSIIRGSTNGNYNDTPVTIQTVADCPAGAHVADVVVTTIQGAWGLPYVTNVGDPPAADFSVNRGFIIEEIW